MPIVSRLREAMESTDLKDQRGLGRVMFANNADLCFTNALGRSGGFSGGPVPDPISNSAVKLPSADGTESQGSEE